MRSVGTKHTYDPAIHHRRSIRLRDAFDRDKVTKNNASDLTVLGGRSLPGGLTALFCSVKCPGKLILDTYDLCQTLRSAAIPVISGFHSPMEQECLRILLKSENRVIWCLARGMLSRMPPELRDPINEGRLLVCTPFQDSVRRITADTASRRNRIVAELAERVVVSHASAGSKMEALSKAMLTEGKPVYTFDHPLNAGILDIGAKRIEDLNLAACSNGSES